MAEDAGFLTRWSRRKADVKSGKPLPDEPLPLPAIAPAVAPAPVAADVSPPAVPAAEVPAVVLPTLDDVAALAPGEEISRFVASGVDEGVKRAAIKKLFTDPHYNVMDGLDIYIDDYSLPDPIPMAMLRQMNQSKFLGLFAEEEAAEARAVAEAEAARLPSDPAEAPAVEAAPSLAQDADPAPAAAVPHAPHEDPDLQLQPDDDSGRPGAATRARPHGV